VDASSWDDDGTERVMISALEHYSYCPRQCALIHIEQTFDENIYTVKGTQAHERVDQAMERVEDGMRVERALPLWSARLGLRGRADVVEFHGATPYPVEYKLGKKREWEHEAVQLCAQALCLEEMLEIPVPAGAIYYCTSRVRREILFDADLRAQVEALAQATRTMLTEGVLPSAVNDRRCEKCSLNESCMPAVLARPGRWQSFAAEVFRVDDDTRERRA
jgi:CRISPR-associated exonuclease Cas4